MIPDIAPVNSWTGNNETKRFEFDFLINSEDELKVLYTNVNQVQTELKLNIDYSINEIGNKNGSYITFPLDNSEYGLLQENETISLLLNIPLAQTTPFATSGLLNLNSLEYALDYIVRLIQIVYRQVERSVKIQEGSKDKPEDYFEYITNATTQANEYANQAKDYADESETLKIETQSARNQSLAYLNEVRDITENFDADIEELVGYVDEAKNEGINAINNEKNNAINSVNEAAAEILEYIPKNYTPLPIGSVISVNASANYTPSGFLPCDGSEYKKADFEKLWDNYLTSEEWVYDENIVLGTDLDGKTQVQLSITNGMTIVAKYNFVSDPFGQTFFAFNFNVSNSTIYLNSGAFVCELDLNSPFYAKYEVIDDTLNTYYSLDGVVYNSIANTSYFPTEFYLNYSDEIPIDLSASYYINEQKRHYFYKNKSLLNTCTYDEYESDLTTYGQCGKFGVKPLGYDGSNLTIVGSLTITPEGVASEFYSSDYIETMLEATPQQEITFSFKGKYISGTNQQCLFRLISPTNEGKIGNLRLTITESKILIVRAYINGVDTNLFSYVTLAVNDNDTIEFELKLGLTTQSLIYKINGVEKTLSNTLDFSDLDLSQNGNLLVGSYASGTLYWNGSIDLKEFSIKVDENIIFDCVSGDTFKVPTSEDTELGFKNFVAVANGTVDDCLATWNTLLELENYLKGV